MHNVWLYLLHPSDEFPCRYMREVGLFAMDAREEGVKFMVKGIANDIPMLCFSHLGGRARHIALYAICIA